MRRRRRPLDLIARRPARTGHGSLSRDEVSCAVPCPVVAALLNAPDDGWSVRKITRPKDNDARSSPCNISPPERRRQPYHDGASAFAHTLSQLMLRSALWMIGWRDRRVMIGPRCGHRNVDGRRRCQCRAKSSGNEARDVSRVKLALSHACGASVIRVCTSTSRDTRTATRGENCVQPVWIAAATIPMRRLDTWFE